MLNHVTENNKENKAKIISTIIQIDGEGKDFAKMVKMSSKKTQENESLTVAETNSLQMGTRSSEYVWRQSRTAFVKTFGCSPLASAKKVDIYRKKIMVVKKEDWKTMEIILYKNKQGKNKKVTQETTVVIVENLFEYILICSSR